MPESPCANNMLMQAMPPSMTIAALPPEILEMILLQLDMKTLLTAVSRVSKSWACFMATSSRIQQALFFQPVPEPFSMEKPVTANPILIEKFGDVFFDLEGDRVPYRRADSFIRQPWGPHEILKLHTLEGRSHKIELNESQKAFVRRGASWRQMLVSQPPLPSFGLVMFESPTPFDQHVEHTMVAAKSPSLGLQMGQIYDLVLQYTCEASDFAVFFKLLWNKPRGHFPSITCQNTCSNLLSQTKLVIEFRHEICYDWYDRGPFPPTAYVDAFTCEEHSPTKVDGMIETKAPIWETVGLSSADFVVWRDPGRITYEEYMKEVAAAMLPELPWQDRYPS